MLAGTERLRVEDAPRETDADTAAEAEEPRRQSRE